MRRASYNLKTLALSGTLMTLAAVTAVGCKSTEEESRRTTQARATAVDGEEGLNIIDGMLVDTAAMPNVGRITSDTALSSSLCSGTLIAPSYVLTAGHCTAKFRGTMKVAFGERSYMVVERFVHPTYSSAKFGREGTYDSAVLRLAEPVSGITPAPLYRTAPQVGQRLTLVGYGVLGTGAAGGGDDVAPAGKVSVGSTVIDSMTPTYIQWVFEQKSGADKESNTAPGDSGGPAFITVGNTLVLAGITSGGDTAEAAFGDNAFDTRVDAIAAWVDSIAGTEPTTTPEEPSTPGPEEPATPEEPTTPNEPTEPAPPEVSYYKLFRAAASRFSHAVGRQGLAGSWEAPAGSPFLRYLTYGGAEMLAPGSYVATFALRADGAIATTSALAIVEIYDVTRHRQVVGKRLYASHFTSSLSASPKLSFTVPEAGAYEFRVFYVGGDYLNHVKTAVQSVD